MRSFKPNSSFSYQTDANILHYQLVRFNIRRPAASDAGQFFTLKSEYEITCSSET